MLVASTFFSFLIARASKCNLVVFEINIVPVSVNRFNDGFHGISRFIRDVVVQFLRSISCVCVCDGTKTQKTIVRYQILIHSSSFFYVVFFILLSESAIHRSVNRRNIQLMFFLPQTLTENVTYLFFLNTRFVISSMFSFAFSWGDCKNLILKQFKIRSSTNCLVQMK